MGKKECPYGRTCKDQHELQHLGEISVHMRMDAMCFAMCFVCYISMYGACMQTWVCVHGAERSTWIQSVNDICMHVYIT